MNRSIPTPRQLQLTRRQFLRQTAAAGGLLAVPWILPASARAGNGIVGPNARIVIGQIGHGVMGRGHLHRLVDDSAVQLVAVCDVDQTRRVEAKQHVEESYGRQQPGGTYRGCDAYNDYRELLARPDIDAVLIATPDHWHTLLTVEACKAGKDVYCEKPVSMNIREGRQLAETVRRYGRVFQTGTQYRSIPTIRRVCEFVRNGGLGHVKAAFTIWGKYRDSYTPGDPLLPAEPVPEGLDWNLWVGPAPWHEYNSAYHRNPAPGVVPWSFCDAFGLAAITGYHSHAADVIQYGLGMETSGPVEIHHPSDGQFPTVTCRYANGTLLHHVEHWGQVKSLYHAVPDDARLEGNFGGLFVGERGWLTSMTGGGPIEGAPESLFSEMQMKNHQVSHGLNTHHANWFDCIRTRRSPSSHEEIGHRSASLGHLVVIAHRLQRSLKWDPAKETFIGDDMANRLRSRALREPWRL